MNFQKIYELSMKEPKSLMERSVKLQEESGELAQEILIHNKSSGTHTKTEGADGILGESVDVMLVALSIFFKRGGTVAMLEEISANKSTKWESLQPKD